MVLSTVRLRRIRAVDPVGQTVTAEAGVTLPQLLDAARENRDRAFGLRACRQVSHVRGRTVWRSEPA